MMQVVRELRLIPVVPLAMVCLAALKSAGLLVDGGYLFTDLGLDNFDRPIHFDRDPATGSAIIADNKVTMPLGGPSWAQEVLGYPEVTGTLPAETQAQKNIDRLGGAAAPRSDKPPDGRVVDLAAKPAASPAERALLERLQQRRQELEARGREIDLRESLLQAAEKKFEVQANDLGDLESSAGGALQRKEEADAQRFKSIVTMYENMKAKDAARIFDRLEMRILVEVASQINPRRMSEILGQMSSEAAERLTVELANRASGGADRGTDIGNLPKIEGTPSN